MGTVSRVGRFLPATKGEVQDIDGKFQGISGEVQDDKHKIAELEEHENETTAIINTLVSKLNSLTPVGSLYRHACLDGTPCALTFDTPHIVQRCHTTSLSRHACTFCNACSH